VAGVEEITRVVKEELVKRGAVVEARRFLEVWNPNACITHTKESRVVSRLH